MRKILVSLCFIAVAIALPAAAQTSMQRVNRITVVKPKPGMTAQWVAGLKKLNEYAHQHNLPLTHYCWSIISGPRTGQFVIGALGHPWADFDTADKASKGLTALIMEDLEPYTESHLTSYTTYREDLSGPPAPKGQAFPAFLSDTTFFLKIGGEPKVEGAIKAADAAAKKAHWQGRPSAWYQTINGSYGGQLHLVTGYENWAAFQPPAKTFFDMLSDVLGKEGVAALGKQFDSGLRGVRSEIWRYDPDLSYIAASK